MVNKEMVLRLADHIEATEKPFGYELGNCFVGHLADMLGLDLMKVDEADILGLDEETRARLVYRAKQSGGVWGANARFEITLPRAEAVAILRHLAETGELP